MRSPDDRICRKLALGGVKGDLPDADAARVARVPIISAFAPYAVARLGIAAFLAVGLTLAPAAAAPADAETAAEAQHAAEQAAARLEELGPQVQAALAAWEQSLAALQRGVSLSVAADASADASSAHRRDAHTDRVNQVRAVYMTGSGPALYGTLLDSADLTDVVARSHSVQTVLRVGHGRTAQAGIVAQADGVRAAALETATEDGLVVAEQVGARWADVAALLASQERELAALAERASTLAAAQAAAVLAAERAAEAARASLAAAAAGGNARARPAPEAYQDLYVRAAQTCAGMTPALLSAVGQVESGHGINVGPSSAGALGPMQFLPGTFAEFGVDGDRDGDKDVFDPADAVFSAAKFLCGGGGGDRAAVSRALFRYNHAQWYVTLVLDIAGQLTATPGAP
jgi:Transglycosylase SLT domain